MNTISASFTLHTNGFTLHTNGFYRYTNGKAATFINPAHVMHLEYDAGNNHFTWLTMPRLRLLLHG